MEKFPFERETEGKKKVHCDENGNQIIKHVDDEDGALLSPRFLAYKHRTRVIYFLNQAPAPTTRSFTLNPFRCLPFFLPFSLGFLKALKINSSAARFDAGTQGF